MAFDDQNISWGEFFKAYTGIKFTIKEDDCQIFVPKYANITHSTTERTSSGNMVSLPVSGTDMVFRDEWSSNSFLIAGEPERLNNVFIKDLWEYPENNVKWDEFLEILSFKDVNVEETNLSEFVSDLDSFLVFNKIAKFGDVWWVSNVKAEIESDDSQYSNVNVANISGGDVDATKIIKFWSPDKYVNDEYKRYVSNPASYNGFLTSDDFENGGWFSVPHLRISTKPFEKLKIAETLLNINFTFEPDPHFGNYYSIDTTIGARIKDSTSSQVLDISQSKNSQNNGLYSGNIVSNWVGGLVSTNNIENLGAIGNYQEDECQNKQNEIEYKDTQDNNNAISHAIDAQISLKPNYSSETRDFLGTIDPINWISVDNEQTENPHETGALNIDRAFGGASGDLDGGLVTGGIRTTENGLTSVIDSSEIWENNTFTKDVLISLNTPRCFHIQGGSLSSTCAIVGGYGSMNNTDYTQFSRYGKTNVLSSMEYFIKNDDQNLSFFRKINDYSMNTARGDAAGTLQVTTNVRQNKFEVENLIDNYNIKPDDEQKILEFVDDQSTNIVNDVPIPSDFRRYNVANINGFIYAGNKSGNVYLIDIPESQDIIDSFENINTTHVDVSQNIIASSTDYERTIENILNNEIVDIPIEVTDNVVTIDGTSEDGSTISLTKCGKYRIEYIDGSYLFQDGNAGEVVDDNIVVDATDTIGTTVEVPYGGVYEVSYLDGEYLNNTVPTSSFDINVDGSSSAGTSFSINRCGRYRFKITAGAIRYRDAAVLPPPNDYRYKSAIALKKPGGSFTTIINGAEEDNPTDAYSNVAISTYIECFEESDLGTSTIKFPDVTGYGDNVGTLSVEIEYIGTSSGCPACGDTKIGIYDNESFVSYIWDTDLDDYHICLNSGAEVKFVVPNAGSSNSGAVTAKLTFISSDCSAISGGAEVYSSNTNLYVNEQLVDNVFVSGVKDSKENVELFNQARPTRQGYNLCVENPGSTIRLAPNDILDDDYVNNGGHINVRVLYIGPDSECECWVLDSQTETSNGSQTTVSETEVTIVYSSIDETKKYPVRCHGLVYVGDEDSGLSTGGRTEYNRISDVECQLRENYGLIAKNSCGSPYSDNILEKNRILDLVYEYDGSTWIKRQNLFESVYYHTGVGDENNSIFWGGLHETLSDYNFSFTINSVDPESIPISAFDCDSFKNYSKNDITTEATGYEQIDALVNSVCWNSIPQIAENQVIPISGSPTWQTAAISGSLVDDPRYVSGEATLAYAGGENFPDILVISPVENPSSFTEQLSGGTSLTYDTNTNSIELSVSYDISGAGTFDVLSYILNSDNTVSTNTIEGTFSVTEISDFKFTNTLNRLYPDTSVGGTFDIDLTDIKTITGGQTIIYYSIDHDDTSGSGFRLRGFGEITFESMQKIWESIVNDETIDATSHKFTVQQNTEYPASVGDEASGTATFKFYTPSLNATFVGVKSYDQVWNTQSSVCGPNLQDFISLNTEYKPANTFRWGTPLWVSGLVEDISGFLNLDYAYNKAVEISSDTYGINEYELTDINIQANDLSSILNDRTLLLGTTKAQDHEFTAINNTTFVREISSGTFGTSAYSTTTVPYSADSSCQDISGSITTGLASTSGSGEGYSEWISSFIQEYRSDERFNLPESFIPSNASDIIGNNRPLSFEPSRWKRYMDGVGLGGDVPNYSTIVDNDGNQKPVSEWQDIGSWYVGQMAFGTPNGAVIVGGHKVDPTKNKIGIHAYQTDKRIFKWDFSSIPPEDTYLKNYLGRRFWNYYIDENGLIIPIDIKPSFGINIFNAESPIVIEKVGSIKFDGSSNTQSVKFTEPFEENVGNNYSINLIPNDNIKCWWESKENSGFEIYIETDTWIGTIDYVVTAEINVTEEKIENLDDLEGYIFTDGE